MNIKAMVNRNKSSRKIGDSSKTRRVENHHKIMDTSLYKLLTVHSNKGYVIVSACRGDKTMAENNANTKRLQEDISNSGWSYKIVRGGFVENKGTDEEREVTEDSFVVFNYKRGDKQSDIDALETFAIEMCGKYNQDSVLVVRPDANPMYVTSSGDIDFELSGNVSIEQNIGEYFTRLGNKRFSFNEIKDSEPKTINGMRVREMKGEIMIDANGHRHYGMNG